MRLGEGLEKYPVFRQADDRRESELSTRGGSWELRSKVGTVPKWGEGVQQKNYGETRARPVHGWTVKLSTPCPPPQQAIVRCQSYQVIWKKKWDFRDISLARYAGVIDYTKTNELGCHCSEAQVWCERCSYVAKAPGHWEIRDIRDILCDRHNSMFFSHNNSFNP